MQNIVPAPVGGMRRHRRWLPLALTTIVAAATAVATAGSSSAEQTIGYPSFSGPAIPAPPVGYSTGNMMQAIYDAESGGTDFWVDRLLARPGSDPSDADGG